MSALFTAKKNLQAENIMELSVDGDLLLPFLLDASCGGIEGEVKEFVDL